MPLTVLPGLDGPPKLPPRPSKLTSIPRMSAPILYKAPPFPQGGVLLPASRCCVSVRSAARRQRPPRFQLCLM